MGPRLGRVEYQGGPGGGFSFRAASMGPRLGRVEYSPVAVECQICIVEALQWGHA